MAVNDDSSECQNTHDTRDAPRGRKGMSRRPLLRGVRTARINLTVRSPCGDCWPLRYRVTLIRIHERGDLATCAAAPTMMRSSGNSATCREFFAREKKRYLSLSPPPPLLNLAPKHQLETSRPPVAPFCLPTFPLRNRREIAGKGNGREREVIVRLRTRCARTRRYRGAT